MDSSSNQSQRETWPVSTRLPIAGRGASLDADVDHLPNAPAVFLFELAGGQIYLGRTALLRRRARRLLSATSSLKSSLNLRSLATSLLYWPAVSKLESALVYYTLARRYHPDSYLEHIKLRMPSYIRLLSGNRFPRTQIASRLSSSGLFFGPFRSRASAETFEASVLDHFQVRRCQEDLDPSPEHPGCVYGEMNLCLRPCQAAVTKEEYASEVGRLSGFLQTGGRGLLAAAEQARDRLSNEMNFEEAARQHRRIEKINATIRLRDELACSIEQLCGVAVCPSGHPRRVSLLGFAGGQWRLPCDLALDDVAANPSSLDARLRGLFQNLVNAPAIGEDTLQERQEHLALLSRWFYSTWRDGEWLAFDSPSKPPYRRLVNMVQRVSAQTEVKTLPGG